MSNTPKDDTELYRNYATKCECSEDDSCGCTYPNNTTDDYNYSTTAQSSVTSSEEVLTVGMHAPDFTAPAVLKDNTLNKNFNFYQQTQNQTTILFFYPEDFYFTCPSELLMLNKEIKSFTKRDTCILGISTDSEYSHLAWKQIPIEKDGIPDIYFPLLSDMTKKISTRYGILDKKGNARRATVIIDKNKIIRHLSINDNKIWRNPEEFLRIIDILNQKTESITNCPRGWKQNFFFERPEAETITEMFSHPK